MGSLDQAWTALQDGDDVGAAERFAAEVAASPTAGEAWIGLAHARRARGDWAGVAEALAGIVRHVPDRALAREAALAEAHVRDRHLGDAVGARRTYEAALQLDPRQPWPYLALAELDLRTGHWNRALAYATHGLEIAGPLAPERPWLLLCRAVGRRRSSLSLGPVSTFFRGLADPSAHPGHEDVALAVAASPPLGRLLSADPLEDLAQLATVIEREMPRPRLPIPR